MPPKKKDNKKKKKGEEEEEETGYNLDIMTKDELKNYAHMLEKGIEEMRKHCSFYQMAEDELSSLYRVHQEELAQKEDSLLAKDIEIEAMRFKVERNIREKSELPKYGQYSSAENERIRRIETNTQIENLANKHEQEQSNLNENLFEKERELEALSKKIQMAKKEASENTHKKLQDLAEYEKDLMDKCTKDFVQMIAEVTSEFSLALNSIEGEALEAKKMAEQEFRHACLSYKEKLQEYYKSMTRQDLELIKNLQLKIKELEYEIGKNTLELKEIQKQNDELKSKTQRRVLIRSLERREESCTKIEKEKLKNSRKMEKLKEENKKLEEEIEKVEDEIINLRSQFTTTLAKIRESAEMKAVVLEQKIDQLFNNTKE